MEIQPYNIDIGSQKIIYIFAYLIILSYPTGSQVH